MDDVKTARLHAIERGIARVARTIDRLKGVSDRLSGIRLTIAVVGLSAVAVTYFLQPLLFAFTLLITSAAFTVVVVLHRRVERHIATFSAWRTLKQAHIARTTLNWAGIPDRRTFSIEPHMLETDLDLRMVHRLLDTSVSREGSARLREWLIPTAPSAEVARARQALVAELTALPTFRDKLTAVTTLAAGKLRAGSALRFAEAKPGTDLRNLVTLLAALAAINVLLFTFAPPTVVAIGWGIYVAVSISQAARRGDVFNEALALAAGLEQLSAVMSFIEGFHFGQHDGLRTLCAPVLQQKPSRQLTRVTRIVSGVSVQANVILWALLNAVMPWDYFFAWRFQVVREELREQLPGWLDVWHELEALGSLATFAYLNPAYITHTLTENGAFRATGLGHPLIKGRVVNDFSLAGGVVIITGSNMSGKSSFLRTLGVNLCLAYAGSVVAADEMETGVFRLFSSMRVTDSLENGISFFYAEVRRLRARLDALETDDPRPVFYLVDEIFRGTNNRERLVGSRSLIRALVDQPGMGLVATHDLELVQLADAFEAIDNYHFRETVDDGQMVFDYTLRAGPSPTTNALTIMRLAGLPVEEEG